ncbi:hypothetical protein [Raineya sp.]|jgi:hypothetical protein
MRKFFVFQFVVALLALIVFLSCQKEKEFSQDFKPKNAIAVLKEGSFVLEKNLELDNLVKSTFSEFEKSYKISQPNASYTLKLQDIKISFDETSRHHFLQILSQRSDNAFVSIAILLEKNGDFLVLPEQRCTHTCSSLDCPCSISEIKPCQGHKCSCTKGTTGGCSAGVLIE